MRGAKTPHPAEPAWSPDDILPEPEDAAGEQQIELFAALAEHLPFRVEPAIGNGDVAQGIDEPPELRVGHLVPVDPDANRTDPCKVNLPLTT